MYSRFLMLLCCASANAWADCEGGETDVYPEFDLGVQYIPRDAPIGSVIGVANQTYTHKAPTITCRPGTWLKPNPDSWEARLNSWPKVTGINLPSIPGLGAGDLTVSKTNVPGVGLIVTASGRTINNWSVTAGVYPNVPYALTNKSLQNIYSVSTSFTLIKISDDIPMGSSSISNSTSAVGFWSGNRRFHSVFLTGTVVRSECSLAGGANANIEVPMGDVMRRDFKGKNSHLESKDIVIPLINCTAGAYPTDQGWNYYQNANAYLRMEGVQGSSVLDAGRGILGLSQDSTAKGLAVQVLRKDGVTPLMLGEDVSIAQLKDDSMNIELKARYIQTSDSKIGPEPGIANARAKFTLTYK